MYKRRDTLQAKLAASDDDPCAGLYGADSLQCAWVQDINTCVEAGCRGCSGEQCELCRSDVSALNKCCQDHKHSTTPPVACADAFVETCVAEQCRGCSGEQCQLCKQDKCCSKSDARGATECVALAKQAVCLLKYQARGFF